ncbi:flagellar basal body P-ring formation protein FlgA [Roseovarius sp. SCSIO 43702]|uniref:flagellar basal body P-ring formation chaperone FlgA n=1 Tax=Roseovarius sp. SCSIO 43702 TaxID=2823043 RepID=UPI001C7304DA|nr:flagellar basal body P-ring formation chaperone FlgA [Roseovarius sp. SCSIO 43702]QYX57094.1 flagellar basal body P-ring formation protein FlgA [Roseovarius sp. SCSIO 43702]
MRTWIAALALLASPAQAESVLAARTLRAQTIVTAQDLVVKDVEIVGAARSIDEIIGRETRIALYAGRPVRPGDVGPPAVVERNQIVPLVFDRGGLRITSEGRSLMRAGPGERIRVMNLASRITVMGRVRADGRVFVSEQE